MEAGIEPLQIAHPDHGEAFSYLGRAQALVASRADLFAVNLVAMRRGAGRTAHRGGEVAPHAGASRQLTLPLQRGRARRPWLC